MVQAIINIDDNTNRVLNIVKAKFGLKDKSQAIDIMAKQYEENLLEPELRPEYIEKAHKIMKQKAMPVDDFAKRYGLN
jgi:predicted transposase YbfD/YdcC